MLEFFGRSLMTPVILKSRLMPREMTVKVRPTTSSVPKRLIASDWLITAVWAAPSVEPDASGRLTTFRKSSSVNI
jgi:hypothetical protein